MHIRIFAGLCAVLFLSGMSPQMAFAACAQLQADKAALANDQKTAALKKAALQKDVSGDKAAIAKLNKATSVDSAAASKETLLAPLWSNCQNAMAPADDASKAAMVAWSAYAQQRYNDGACGSLGNCPAAEQAVLNRLKQAANQAKAKYTSLEAVTKKTCKPYWADVAKYRKVPSKAVADKKLATMTTAKQNADTALSAAQAANDAAIAKVTADQAAVTACEAIKGGIKMIGEKSSK